MEVNGRLDMSQQCACVAWKCQQYPGLHLRGMASRETEMTVRPPSRVLHPGLSARKMENCWSGSRVTKKIRRLEHPSCNARLRQLDFFSLEKASGRPHCRPPVL